MNDAKAAQAEDTGDTPLWASEVGKERGNLGSSSDSNSNSVDVHIMGSLLGACPPISSDCPPRRKSAVNEGRGGAVGVRDTEATATTVGSEGKGSAAEGEAEGEGLVLTQDPWFYVSLALSGVLLAVLCSVTIRSWSSQREYDTFDGIDGKGRRASAMSLTEPFYDRLLGLEGAGAAGVAPLVRGEGAYGEDIQLTYLDRAPFGT